jgi:hypothetical protein
MSYVLPDLSVFNVEQKILDEDFLEARSRKRSGDRRVCICGHPMARHRSASGRIVCETARSFCLCVDAIPVIQVEDLRPFIFRTYGANRYHAFVKGVAVLRKKQRGLTWLITPQCFACKMSDTTLNVAPIGRAGYVMIPRGEQNALLCDKCFYEKGGL